MMELEKILEEYKTLTMEMLKEIDNAERLVALLDKRQETIDAIRKNNFQQKDLIELVNELNLLELDKQLKNNIEKEQLKTKKALTNVRRLRQARRSYIKRDGMPNFLDKST